MAVILTSPTSVTSNRYTLTDTIPSNTTTIIDTVNITDFPVIKWIVNIVDTNTNQNLTQEILASYNNTIRYNRYSLVGDLIPHLVSVSMNENNDAILSITNTSSNTYNTYVTHLFVN